MRIRLLYDKAGMEVHVPETAAVLEPRGAEPIADPAKAVTEALEKPIGSAPLSELLKAKRPGTAAITISDITRPVPNKVFLPPMLRTLNAAGVADSRIVIVIGTGMHRPSTPEERETLLGKEIQSRIEVIDHTAQDPRTLVKVSDDPPVSINRRFAEADFRIVTGFIEPHFMAGFSGGRKGVCPGLVDLATIERFHGCKTLADPRADAGVLEGNPCHKIALEVAKTVGVDFLFNVAITRSREIAGIYCGDLVEAHLIGCKDVTEWTTAFIDGKFDLVITNGGGYALDTVFYQAAKGMCGALPALGPDSTLLIATACSEGLGSKPFAELVLSYGSDWKRFLADIAATDHVKLDQWDFQMRSRLLKLIGIEKLWLATDGIDPEIQKRLAVTPILGDGDAQARAQRAIDEYAAAHPAARVAVIPDGPYTLLNQMAG